MADSEKMASPGNVPPEHCSTPDGECLAILQEYADAIRLIHRMRDTAGEETHAHVRHWSLPRDKISADFFCTAEHPRFGWYGLMADVSGHGLV
jgi:hypothetical protein